MMLAPDDSRWTKKSVFVRWTWRKFTTCCFIFFSLFVSIMQFVHMPVLGGSTEVGAPVSSEDVLVWIAIVVLAILITIGFMFCLERGFGEY
jgi:hypothetical protein